MEGQRVKKESEKPGRKGLVLSGAIAAALLAGYIGLSAWVGMSDQVMPNVTVGGMDVSGMTQIQVQQMVENALERHSGNAQVSVTRQGWSGALDGSALELKGENVGRQAYQVGRSNFFVQGFQYIRHLLGGETEVVVPVSIKEEQFLALRKETEEAVGGRVIQASYQVEGDTLTITKGKTGVAIDWEQVRENMTAAFREEVLPKAFAGGQGMAELELPVAETPPETPDFNAIRAEIYTQVKDAAMDPETHQVTDHVVGIDFDVNELKRAYEGASEGEAVAIPLMVTQPKDTRESFEAKLFRDVLGAGTSTVSGTSNRKTNVRLSAAACDGVILLPGEEFSYNNTTGSRSADKGYLPAGVYVGGVSMDEVGGGICQTSSTIYYAVLHSTLEITERHDHKFAVGYVPDGMDATVYYGSLDFRFKNSTNYPIKVVTESYDSGGVRKLTAKIYGTNEDGRYGVPERTQFDWVEPTKSYLADQTVPQGTLVLDTKQNAYTGRKAQTFRYIYEQDGTLVEKQDLGVSKYDMRPHLYHYNPLDGNPATWPDGVPPKPQVAPAPEPTPETGAADPVVDPPVDPVPGGGTVSEGETPVEQPGDGAEEIPAEQPADGAEQTD